VCLALLSMSACGNGDMNEPAAGGEEAMAGAAGAMAESGGDATAGGTAAAEGSVELGLGPGEVPTDFEDSDLFVTRMKAPRIGLASSPHRIQQIYYSRNLEPVLGEGSFGALPEGTVAVKIQSRDGDDVIDQVMVMIKQAPGVAPDTGGWVFEQRKPGTLKLVSSSTDDASFGAFCAGCHAGFSQTDWLAGTQISD
jgi:hypothetical protein